MDNILPSDFIIGAGVAYRMSATQDDKHVLDATLSPHMHCPKSREISNVAGEARRSKQTA